MKYLDRTFPAVLLAGCLAAFATAGCERGDEEPSGAPGPASSQPEPATGQPGATADKTAPDPALPELLRIREPGLHPEGIEWDGRRGRFLVSSVTRGTVTAVRDDGSHETFIEDDAVAASIGIHIDGGRDRLLVMNADPGAFRDEENNGQARLAAYDLTTGERHYLTDLAPLADGRHFGNDVTSAPDGAAYATDSLSPVIYRVSPEGEPSVFLEDERLGGDGFGLNGIDYHPDGYLVVAMAGDRTFYRIPVDNPEAMEEISLPEPIQADGIVFRSPDELAVVGNTFRGEESRREVLLLSSGDGWQSASIAGRQAAPLQPTTAAVREGAVYAVTPHFGRMGEEQPVEVFEIFRVDFGSPRTGGVPDDTQQLGK